jgi:hypothetical protein
MKRFILTGAPGAGKTAVIRQLELDGFSVVEEAATDIIALEQSHAVSEPGSIPRNPRGEVVGKVWKCNGNCTFSTAFHSGSQTGCHIGSMSHEQESSRPFSRVSRPYAPPSPRDRP